MRFPPSTRLYAPLLVLVFGLAVTWIEYELNLSNNLARNLKDVEAQADATGDRMTRRTVKQFQRGEPLLLAENIAGWAHEPWLKVAALVDENGVVIDDSEKRWIGRLARETTLSPAMKLADNIGKDPTHRQSRSPDGSMLFGAYAYTLEGRGTGWALLIYDRGDAVAQARLDANIQLRWAASGIALMCLCLWAALHFGFAARLSRLTQQVRDVGEGRATGVEAVTGGDEVRELSAAFAKMVVQLGQREAERVRLEREILETTERERRRIGRELHDGLGQQLTAASLATHGLISAVESAVPSLVPQVERLGQQLCPKVRPAS